MSQRPKILRYETFLKAVCGAKFCYANYHKSRLTKRAYGASVVKIEGILILFLAVSQKIGMIARRLSTIKAF